MPSRLASTQVRERIGIDKWRGKTVQYEYNSNAAGAEAKLWDSTFPGMSGDTAPRVVQVSVEKDWRPGRSRVTALYETPRSPKSAEITWDTVSVAEDMEAVATADFGAAWTAVPGKPNPVPKGERNLYRWRVLESDQFVLQRPLISVILKTAALAADFKLSTVVALHDHVNSKPAPVLGSLEKRQLWLKNTRSVQTLNPTDLVYIDYEFLLNPDGWDEDITVVLTKSFPTQVNVKDSTNANVLDDAGNNVTETIVGEKPFIDKDGKRIERVIERFQEADFGKLAALASF
jgi:hypothetical protein